MKAESLDHAARMMDDINRRISLYRSGTKVIGQEKKVIDMLDKIIEELEKQQQQQQGSLPTIRLLKVYSNSMNILQFYGTCNQ